MRARSVAATALTTLTAGVLAAAPASAHFARPLSFSFAASGTTFDTGVAVDQETGAVYVAGYASSNVEKFSASGADEPSFIAPSVGNPYALAVDNSGSPSKGDVYVAGSTQVVKFGPLGETVAGFTPITSGSFPTDKVGSEGFSPGPVAVDPENGDLVVEDLEHSEVNIFSESGEFITQFKGELGGVAVGSGHVIFTSGEAGVQEWSPSDEYSTPTTIDHKEAGALSIALGLPMAPTTRVIAAEGETIVEYGLSGELLGQFGTGEFGQSLGVAVNEKTNTVYVASLNFSVMTVRAYGPSFVLPDVVTETPAISVASTTAALRGTVDPDETTVSTCRFEYGLSTSYTATSPCSAGPPLTGNAAIREETNLSGLQPNQTYHYRLMAVSANGTSYGEDKTLSTLSARPSLDDQSVSGLTENSAILNASINPNNEGTTYHFEFGPSTAYGTTLPVPDGEVGSGYGDVPVGQQLSGLSPGTTYHFRVIATNKTGVSTGADQTFTTISPRPPLAGTGLAGEVSPFGATISGTIDPDGVKTTYEFDVGVDTGYGTRIFGEAGSGTEAQTVSVSLRELTSDTTYHYRLVATNVYGISYGTDQTFTTPAVPTSMLSPPAATPLIPEPPFPEQTAAGSSATESSIAAKSSRSKHAKASRSIKRRGRHGSAARRTRRASRAHRNGGGRR